MSDQENPKNKLETHTQTNADVLTVDGPFSLKLFTVYIPRPGVYNVNVYPEKTWISIVHDGKLVKFSKGHARFEAVTGKYEVIIRHEKLEDINYQVNVKSC